ncbi:MAG: tRNA pseudouridine(55) synthase TruB [Acidobacteria bacterium]|nr:tRNA pseudouridine(55) synthase TruB [Acidobacteriota bacterium]
MGRRSRNDADVHGLAVVDKPAGMTSHDVVASLRRTLGTRRVGHSGTLDPAATGVLLLGVGKATRLLRFTDRCPKRYVATMRLGVETSTLDAQGEVTATHDMAGVTFEDAKAAVSTFCGVIEQIPPMVSALKVDGRRLHELAREGIEVEREPRSVTIHSLSVAPGSTPDRLDLDVLCSSGTYVRTLAADIGAALGGGAHVETLRRLSIGDFTDDMATGLDDIELRPVGDLVAHLGHLEVDQNDAARVGHGQLLAPERFATLGEGPFAVIGPTGELLAVYERSADRIKPAVVLPPTS